jgi:hypothetical protein
LKPGHTDDVNRIFTGFALKNPLAGRKAEAQRGWPPSPAPISRRLEYAFQIRSR